MSYICGGTHNSLHIICFIWIVVSVCVWVFGELMGKVIGFRADCGQENTLKPGDVLHCRECGYLILYKKRTRRSNFLFLVLLSVVNNISVRLDSLQSQYVLWRNSTCSFITYFTFFKGEKGLTLLL